jgi:hypothetical protein
MTEFARSRVFFFFFSKMAQAKVIGTRCNGTTESLSDIANEVTRVVREVGTESFSGLPCKRDDRQRSMEGSSVPFSKNLSYFCRGDGR